MKKEDRFIYEEFLPSLLKRAQQAAPAQDFAAVRGEGINTLAKKMIETLEAQFDGFTSDKANAALHTTDLTTLNKLFLFLSENNIKRAGFPIVVKYNGPNEVAYQQFSDEDKAKYSNYPDVDETPDFYVNKSLLNDYLQQLLEQDDPLLNVLLKQRISEANSQLKLNFKPQEKANQEIVKDKASSYYKENEVNPENSGQSVEQLSAIFTQMLSKLPLEVADIDFTRINRFFSLYLKILNSDVNTQSGGNAAEAKRLMQSVNQSMLQASQNSKGNLSNFSAKSSPDQFKGFVKDPQSTYYLGLVHNLMDVVRGVDAVVRNFISRYGKRLDPDQLNAFQQQTVGNSVYQSNWNNLSLLERGFTGK